jgi:hypothetical protein
MVLETLKVLFTNHSGKLYSKEKHMLSIKLDANGEFEVRWPQGDDGVVTLATNYIAYESSLPEEQRLPLPALTLVQQKLAQAQAAIDSANRGEADRAAAAEQLRQTLEQARALLTIAVLSLRARYASNLAQLEHWGLQTRTTARGITVRKPDNDSGLIAFMATYIVREQSLSSEERISEPPLASIVTAANTIEQSLTTRRNGTAQRTIGIEVRTAATARLLDLLELAAYALVVTRYDGNVMTALASWGFEVNARTTRSATPPANGVPATPPT